MGTADDFFVEKAVNFDLNTESLKKIFLNPIILLFI